MSALAPAFRKLCAGVALLLSALACHAQADPADCLSYEPTNVALHGVLFRRSYQGARKSDAPEIYWFVKLDAPICVDEDKSEPDLNPSQQDIDEVQLVVDPDVYRKQKHMLGKKVVANGTLFGAHTAHHHTPVLLTLSSLEPPPAK